MINKRHRRVKSVVAFVTIVCLCIQSTETMWADSFYGHKDIYINTIDSSESDISESPIDSSESDIFELPIETSVSESDIVDDNSDMLGYISIDEDNEVVSIHENTESDIAVQSDILPETYRTEKLPPIKKQSPYGSCWAFATIASLEINLMKKGYSDIDLSEMHLINYAYNLVNDPMEGLKGDDISYIGTSKNMLYKGGTFNMALNALIDWRGAALETLVPYNEEMATQVIDGTLPDNYAYNDVAHIRNCRIINIADMEDIKQAIMEYGSVATQYYAYPTYSGNSYYNSKTSAYYCYDKKTVNHAINIVGWDDTFSASNFVTEPEGDGAWIVRNSWGTSFGENGYFYMSYYDKTLSATAYAIEGVMAEEDYDNVYEYDGAMKGVLVGTENKSNTLLAANVFKTSSKNEAEKIEAASFEVPGISVNLDYTIKVYTDLLYADEPDSGILKATKTGKTTYGGFYTIQLDSPIYVAAGETYAIVVELKKYDGIPYIMRDTSYTSEDWYETISSAEAGQSFIYSPSKKTWIDYGVKKNGNFRIKAFTNKAQKDDDNTRAVTGIKLNNSVLSGDIGDSAELIAKVVPDNATDYRVRWSSENESVATVSRNGKVEFKAKGETVITATSVDGNYSATCKVMVIKPVESISLDVQNCSMYPDETAALSVVYNPLDASKVDDTVWISSDENVVSVDKSGVVTAKSFGTAIVTAKVGKLSAECEVTVKIDTDSLENAVTVYNGVDYSAVYNAADYVINNCDVYKAYGLNQYDLIEHFVNFGMAEGRCASADFNVVKYAYCLLNDDLRAAFGGDMAKYYEHYMKYGQYEGRSTSDWDSIFDAEYYLQANPDVKQYLVDKYTSDGNLLGWCLWHYCEFGANEGRLANKNFSVLNYAAVNPDVFRAYSVYNEGDSAASSTSSNASNSTAGNLASSALNNAAGSASGSITTDFKAIAVQYLQFGFPEGRPIYAKVNMNDLPTIRPDVVQVLGISNLSGWIDWYINYGVNEL